MTGNLLNILKAKVSNGMGLGAGREPRWCLAVLMAAILLFLQDSLGPEDQGCLRAVH